MMNQGSAPTAYRAREPGQRRGPGRRKRPHPSSQQPPSLREGNMAPESWWNLILANQIASKREI
jgi:hypothetical protein